ncbi:MAG: hypothetical protein WC227_03945 [Patescibacteria group bacterium]|jgi:hypothetical protein
MAEQDGLNSSIELGQLVRRIKVATGDRTIPDFIAAIGLAEKTGRNKRFLELHLESLITADNDLEKSECPVDIIRAIHDLLGVIPVEKPKEIPPPPVEKTRAPREPKKAKAKPEKEAKPPKKAEARPTPKAEPKKEDRVDQEVVPETKVVENAEAVEVETLPPKPFDSMSAAMKAVMVEALQEFQSRTGGQQVTPEAIEAALLRALDDFAPGLVNMLAALITNPLLVQKKDLLPSDSELQQIESAFSDSMQDTSDDQADREAALDKRETALDNRERALNTREDQLTTREKEIERREKALKNNGQTSPTPVQNTQLLVPLTDGQKVFVNGVEVDEYLLRLWTEAAYDNNSPDHPKMDDRIQDPYRKELLDFRTKAMAAQRNKAQCIQASHQVSLNGNLQISQLVEMYACLRRSFEETFNHNVATIALYANKAGAGPQGTLVTKLKDKFEQEFDIVGKWINLMNEYCKNIDPNLKSKYACDFFLIGGNGKNHK